jgi:hypothetical protein
LKIVFLCLKLPLNWITIKKQHDIFLSNIIEMIVQEQKVMTASTFLNMPQKSRFSEKYRKGLKGIAVYSIAEIKKNQPQYTLLEALTDILKDTNPDMPTTFVMEFVQHIVKAWEAYETTDVQLSELALA